MITNSSEGSLPVKFYSEMRLGGPDILAGLGIKDSPTARSLIEKLDFPGQFSPSGQLECDAECLRQMSEEAQGASEAAQEARSDVDIIVEAILRKLGYWNTQIDTSTPGIDIPNSFIPEEADVRAVYDDTQAAGQSAIDAYNRAQIETGGTAIPLAVLIVLGLTLAFFALKGRGKKEPLSGSAQRANRIGKQP